MGELTLVGLHEDGEHVVLQGPDGQRFRLPIDDALRAAVRRDRAQLEQVRAERTGSLPPREVQARIRSGASAEDVAADSGVPVALVRRYEGPVLAEREYVAARARATRIGHDPDAPELGELVTDRLATRGVDPSAIGWDARRAGSSPWSVEVTFPVGAETRSARWTYDAQTRTVRAEDDEARWLSETELLDSPIPRRHLAAVRQDRRQPGADVDAALRPVLASVDLPPAPVEDETEPEDPRLATEALLDDLTGRRGTRQELDVDAAEDDGAEGDEFEGFGPQHAFDFDNPDLTVPAAHPPLSRPDLATDAQVLPLPGAHGGPDEAAQEQQAPVAAAEEAGGAPTRGRQRKGRASVPSWDEIVFGAKPE